MARNRRAESGTQADSQENAGSEKAATSHEPAVLKPPFIIPDLPCRVSREILSHDEYHRADAINASGLSLVSQSPLHYWYHRIGPGRGVVQSDPAKDFGTGFHALMESEEKFLGRYTKTDVARRGTKAWEEAEMAAGGRELIKAEDWDALFQMRDAVRAHPRALPLIAGNGERFFEETFFWERDGHACKARADVFAPSLAIVDYKSTTDASPSGFLRQAWNLGYYRSAAWYVDGVHAVTGDLVPYVFIAIEKKPPFAVGVYFATPEMLAIGREEVARDFERLIECKRTGKYPGYSSEIEPLGLPPWRAKRSESPSTVEMQTF